MRRFATLLLTLFLISCMIFTAYAAEAMVIIVPETVETSPQKSKVEARRQPRLQSGQPLRA